tara:strand:+ start:2765 stop:2992 length:228 start_codon:yes stop_codon:yes gene_type:complete
LKEKTDYHAKNRIARKTFTLFELLIQSVDQGCGFSFRNPTIYFRKALHHMIELPTSRLKDNWNILIIFNFFYYPI